MNSKNSRFNRLLAATLAMVGLEGRGFPSEPSVPTPVLDSLAGSIIGAQGQPPPPPPRKDEWPNVTTTPRKALRRTGVYFKTRNRREWNGYTFNRSIVFPFRVQRG